MSGGRVDRLLGRAIPRARQSAQRAHKPRAFILDGEVAVYDRAFISRFEWLRRRPTDEPATLRLLERLVRSHGMIFAARRLSRNGLKAWEEALRAGSRASSRRTPSHATCRGARSPGSR